MKELLLLLATKTTDLLHLEDKSQSRFRSSVIGCPAFMISLSRPSRLYCPGGRFVFTASSAHLNAAAASRYKESPSVRVENMELLSWSGWRMQRLLSV